MTQTQLLDRMRSKWARGGHAPEGFDAALARIRRDYSPTSGAMVSALVYEGLASELVATKFADLAATQGREAA